MPGCFATKANFMSHLSRSTPQPFSGCHFQDATLRLELGDLPPEAVDFLLLRLHLAMARKDMPRIRLGLPHSAPQHTLGDMQVAAGLRHRPPPHDP